MKQLFTLLFFALFAFGCSDNDNDNDPGIQSDELIGVWKNTEEKTPSNTGFGDTYIKIERLPMPPTTHRIFRGYDIQLGWRGFIAARVPEEGYIYTRITDDNALFSYVIKGDILTIKFVEFTETPMTLTPYEKEKTFRYKRTTEVN